MFWASGATFHKSKEPFNELPGATGCAMLSGQPFQFADDVWAERDIHGLVT